MFLSWGASTEAGLIASSMCPLPASQAISRGGGIMIDGWGRILGRISDGCDLRTPLFPDVSESEPTRPLPASHALPLFPTKYIGWQTHDIPLTAEDKSSQHMSLQSPSLSIAFQPQTPSGKQLYFTMKQLVGSGPRLNIKTVFPRYGDSHVKDKPAVRPAYL